MAKTYKINTETENLLASVPTDVIVDRHSNDALATETVPAKPPRQSCCGWRCCCISFTLIIYFLFLTYLVIFPVVFYLSPSLQRGFVFFNGVFPKVQDPGKMGLNCTSELRINSNGDISLGAWYIPSLSDCDPTRPRTDPLKTLATAKRVILYAHGSGASRGNPFRIKAYKVFVEHMDAHVVAFDYRGYADSTPPDAKPSVEGVVNDTRAVYEWILSSGLPSERILLWGHSLGTSISVNLLSRLNTSQYPMATVLEAPFTNFQEEISMYPINSIYRHLPWFNALIVQPVVTNPELNFDSISLLPRVRCPLLILHAEDDRIVPISLGRKLYETARQVQPTGIANRTQFHAFPAGFGYGHNHIRRAPDLPKVVLDFLHSI